MMSIGKLTLASLALAGTALYGSETNWLSSLELSKVHQDWGTAGRDRSVDGRPISIGGKKFTHGVGTHATSVIRLALDGQGEWFTASVGADDEVLPAEGSVTFAVIGDGKLLWQTGPLETGKAAKLATANLQGIKTLLLAVGDADDGINYDHADWAEAQVVMRSGTPFAETPTEADLQLAAERLAGSVNPNNAPPTGILTPPLSPKPAIHSAKVFGVRPGSPFIFTIAATGQRPLTFAADQLPSGLKLDPTTGRISGSMPAPGEFLVTLHARNSLGTTDQKFKIICGSTIGLTPALGWNSWNCFAGAVTAEKVKQAADAMVKSGLVNHGWTYINIDDFWEKNPGASGDPSLQGPGRDAEGHIVANPRFPDMKGLADYVHGLGLKIGLYSSPGPTTCGGCLGSWRHEELDAKQYADWGFDYLKYDWCSYGDVAIRNDLGNAARKFSALEVAQFPYQVMHAALAKAPRDILFSLCQYGDQEVWKWGAQAGGNSWRTTGDITDNWSSLAEIGFSQAGHEPYAGPGHFNDPDMLIVGKVGWGPSLHPTHLTHDEQYTHISLWCLLASPLLIGCDMTQFDAFTLNLLTNDEVIEVDQDPLGRQAARISQVGKMEVWAKEMEDGSKAVGLFNRSADDGEITVKWSDLGLTGNQVVRDLWRQTDLGSFNAEYKTFVKRHGVTLVRLRAAK